MHPARYHVAWTRSSRRTKANVVSILIIISFLGIYNYFRDKEDPIAVARVHEEVRDLLLKSDYQRYGVECSPKTKTCFQIVDRIMEDRKKFDYLHNSQLTVVRYMTLVDLKGYSNSGTWLKTPEKLTWENSNSSQWQVDKSRAPEGYYQMIILSPFCTEAMSDTTERQQRVLMLGLGGGTIPNFLSITDRFNLDIHTTVVELDPFMTGLARKYFDFKSVEGRTKLIIENGIDALKTAVQKREKYNAVFLDACYSSDQESGLLCPVKEFFTADTVKDIHVVLEDGGTVSINTVFGKQETEWQNKWKKLMMEFFPSCDFVSFGRETKMLICTKKADWSWKKHSDRFKKNLLRVNKLFGFQLHHHF